MKLYIDTSNSEKIQVKLGKLVVEKESQDRRSQTLLETISEALALQGTTLQEVKSVEVNLGPGSFTGLRVGVSVANALGYLLNIPVNGKRISEKSVIEPKY